MHSLLLPLLADQCGVVSRRQATAAGVARHELVRLLRRRELAELHPGVYVDHTGAPTWLQRAWGGVLLYPPTAVLAGQSALRLVEGPGSRRRGERIELAVPWDRHLTPPPGLSVVRTRHLADRALWHASPPRLRYEDAALDVAARMPTEFAVLGELSLALQSRCTHPTRLLAALEARARTPHGDWLRRVLADLVEGVSSVLEHGYAIRVERPHGLASGRRQVRDRVGPGIIYRDVLYPNGRSVELDGRLFHDTTAQRDKDMDRDLVTAGDGGDTRRLSWGQVYDRPCWTAFHLNRWLLGDPLAGLPRLCGPTCGAAALRAAG